MDEPTPNEKVPQWLEAYRKRTVLVRVIDMAFDASFTDRQVRDAIKEAAQELGTLVAPDGGPQG